MRKVLVAAVTACLFALCLSAQVAHAESIKLCPTGEVTALCNEFPSIQAAVDAAGSGSFIILASGVYTEPGTLVDKDLTILGQGSDNTIVQAANIPCTANNRVFSVEAARVKIQDLAVRNGCIYDPFLPAAGGGIWNSGSLTLKHVFLYNNLVIYNEKIPLTSTVPITWIPMGGAIYNVGALVVDSSAIMSNSVGSTALQAMGGGIYNNGHSYVVNSTISENKVLGASLANAKFQGGGIYNAGLLSLKFTTVITNEAVTAGGGLYSEGAIHLANNLFSGNKPSASEVACPIITPIAAGANQLAGADIVTDAQCNPPMPKPICFEPELGVRPVPYYIPCATSASIDAGMCREETKVKVDLRGSTRRQGRECDLGAIERGIALIPIVFSPPRLPDLVVRSVTIEPRGQLDTNTEATITVIVENIGDHPTPHGFYVNLYINPRETPPNRAGVIWIDLCHTADCIKDEGIIWVGPATLHQNETYTFTSNLKTDPTVVRLSSKYDGYLPEGEVNMWVYVDAWSKDRSPDGIVEELNEENNMLRVPPFTVKKGRFSAVAASDEQWNAAPPIAPLEP
jgi:hypothetical protein